MFFPQVLLGVTAALPAAFAAPAAEPNPQGGFFAPAPIYCAKIDSAEEFSGESWQIGTAVAGGEGLTMSTAHTVGTTWTKGGDIGLSFAKVLGANADFSASVSETITDTITIGSSHDCPPGAWRCSLLITPGMMRFKGHTYKRGTDESCPGEAYGEEAEFEFESPRKDEGGNPYWTPDVCTCGNLEHWADPGHPALLCKDECVDGATKMKRAANGVWSKLE